MMFPDQAGVIAMQRPRYAMTGAEAVALGMRAYGFMLTSRHEKGLAAGDVPAETGSLPARPAVLVDAIDHLIRDERLLSRFGERTGFAPEAAYEARRHLART